jgi:hypothetical protein
MGEGDRGLGPAEARGAPRALTKRASQGVRRAIGREPLEAFGRLERACAAKVPVAARWLRVEASPARARACAAGWAAGVPEAAADLP